MARHLMHRFLLCSFRMICDTRQSVRMDKIRWYER